MILIVSKGKKAKAVLAGNGKLIAQDAATAIFAIARGVLEHNPKAFTELISMINGKLGEIMKEEEADK